MLLSALSAKQNHDAKHIVTISRRWPEATEPRAQTLRKFPVLSVVQRPCTSAKQATPMACDACHQMLESTS